MLQKLVHPGNICGHFLARAGIDQIHTKGVLRVCRKDVPMCPPRQPGCSSRLPPPQPSPRVCTLHVSDVPVQQQQYTPSGPLAEARLGTNAVKVAGRSHTIFTPPALSTAPWRYLGPAAAPPLSPFWATTLSCRKFSQMGACQSSLTTWKPPS